VVGYIRIINFKINSDYKQNKKDGREPNMQGYLSERRECFVPESTDRLSLVDMLLPFYSALPEVLYMLQRLYMTVYKCSLAGVIKFSYNYYAMDLCAFRLALV
jgi:hypothetical protein